MGLWCRFNKTEEEFETLEEYNDYLEMVEDISEWMLLWRWMIVRKEELWWFDRGGLLEHSLRADIQQGQVSSEPQDRGV